MDSMNWVETSEPTVRHASEFAKTIGGLSSKEPLEDSKIVESKDKVPQDESVIYLNGGHTTNIPTKLLHDNSELYYIKNIDKATGEEYYSKHASIKIDTLLENKLFKESSDAKDEIFEGVYQQLGQDDQTQRLNILVSAIKRSKGQPLGESAQKLLDTIENVLTRQYSQAKATRRLLKAAGNYSTQKKVRDIAKEQVDRILGGGPLEDQLEATRKTIKEAQAA